MYYKKSFDEINLGEKLNNLGNLNHTFQTLKKLNSILEKVLPQHISHACHIGAIDYNESVAVLYVTQQQIFHLIRNFSNTILQEFTHHNFYFDKLLIRNKITTKNPFQAKAPIDNISRDKLSQIAKEIGKPEIIKPLSENIKNNDNDIIII